MVWTYVSLLVDSTLTWLCSWRCALGIAITSCHTVYTTISHAPLELMCARRPCLANYPVSKSIEVTFWQWFCEYVRKLIFWLDWLDVYPILLDVLNKMQICSWSDHWDCSYKSCPVIFFEHAAIYFCSTPWQLHSLFAHFINHSNGCWQSLAQCYEFCFGCG